MAALTIPVLLLAAVLYVPQAEASVERRYCLDEPVIVDFDMEDIPEPRESVKSFYYDFLDSTFFQQAKQAFHLPRNFRKLAGRPIEALNANCLDEVPDSSWFTNRNGKLPMTLDEIERGPNRGGGPSGDVWTVFRGKTEGITPGFLIRDETGQIYGLKFDPPAYPELGSAAEVVGSRLYYAAGYNVKENFVVHFTRDRLRLDPKAKTKDQFGRVRGMTEADLEDILSRVARRTDGSWRAVAGKYLDGTAKGPFSFYGMRADDPNDLIPHEHRRDLRGLRVIAGWLNDNDVREGNTLDMYVEEDGRRFLRHYIIDAGSSLGSDTTHPNIDRIGNEYQLDAGEIAKSFFSLGLYRRPWKAASGRLPHASVGYIDAEHFDPGRWKPNYPIVAFENMTALDAFWAARIVLSFSDEQIRAAVRSGRFSDPRAEELLAGILAERRDKIGRHWLERVNPVAEFLVAGADLAFENLKVKYGFAEGADFIYRYRVRREGGAVLFEGERRGGAAVPLTGPTGETEGIYEVLIATREPASRREWPAVRIYLRRTAEGGFGIIGIQRTV